MHAFFEDYLERLTKLHQGIIEAIKELPPEAFEWVPLDHPSAEMNSINILVTHLAGAERYWIGDMALGDPSGRVRDEEFLVEGLAVESLIEKINSLTEYAQTALEKIDINKLDERRHTHDDQTFSRGWSLLHALEHTALHLGHIQITRQLWEERK
ncbi:MAG: DinB family protein [Anaerolineales bacterium]|nr:DinB family protein [Chloroflexota bacterium]MBL6981462.1 DinB family protein [Anaerolineales bacterium]